MRAVLRNQIHIADDHRDALLFLYLVCVPSRLRNRLINMSKRLFLDERIAERVGDEQTKLGERERRARTSRMARLEIGSNLLVGLPCQSNSYTVALSARRSLK
jgi:hypothetical protein